MMPGKRKTIPPYIQRGLLGLIILLMGISVARLLVTMHQQEERIGILEHQVEQLMSDTSRLQITPYPQRLHKEYSTTWNASGSHSRHRHKEQSRERTTEALGIADSLAAIPSAIPAADSPQRASHTDRPQKFTEPHVFDLNTIDSLTLIRIPGIASRTASVILKNRQRYGGFYSAEQLREFLTWDAALEYLDEWCSLWFTADANRLRTIPLNTATISALQRHPYISHEQAVEITNYRRRHKRIAVASELQQLSTFSAQQLQQLLPYLSFE